MKEKGINRLNQRISMGKRYFCGKQFDAFLVNGEIVLEKDGQESCRGIMDCIDCVFDDLEERMKKRKREKRNGEN